MNIKKILVILLGIGLIISLISCAPDVEETDISAEGAFAGELSEMVDSIDSIGSIAVSDQLTTGASGAMFPKKLEWLSKTVGDELPGGGIISEEESTYYVGDRIATYHVVVTYSDGPVEKVTRDVTFNYYTTNILAEAGGIGDVNDDPESTIDQHYVRRDISESVTHRATDDNEAFDIVVTIVKIYKYETLYFYFDLEITGFPADYYITAYSLEKKFGVDAVDQGSRVAIINFINGHVINRTRNYTYDSDTKIETGTFLRTVKNESESIIRQVESREPYTIDRGSSHFDLTDDTGMVKSIVTFPTFVDNDDFLIEKIETDIEIKVNCVTEAVKTIFYKDSTTRIEYINSIHYPYEDPRRVESTITVEGIEGLVINLTVYKRNGKCLVTGNRTNPDGQYIKFRTFHAHGATHHKFAFYESESAAEQNLFSYIAAGFFNIQFDGTGGGKIVYRISHRTVIVVFVAHRHGYWYYEDTPEDIHEF